MRTRLFPSAGEAWNARIFTPRSASVRQTFPRVPGRSSKRIANSLDVGIVIPPLNCQLFAGNGGRGVPAKSETLGFRLDRLTSYTVLGSFSRVALRCCDAAMPGMRRLRRTVPQ